MSRRPAEYAELASTRARSAAKFLNGHNDLIAGVVLFCAFLAARKTYRLVYIMSVHEETMWCRKWPTNGQCTNQDVASAIAACFVNVYICSSLLLVCLSPAGAVLPVWWGRSGVGVYMYYKICTTMEFHNATNPAATYLRTMWAIEERGLLKSRVVCNNMRISAGRPFEVWGWGCYGSH